jgi:hypothetical protein
MLENRKKESIKRISLIALDEIISHKGLPKDESESVSCKDFLSLVCQYTNSYATKAETQNILKEILSDKVDNQENKTIEDVLLEHLSMDQIIKPLTKKKKLKCN